MPKKELFGKSFSLLNAKLPALSNSRLIDIDLFLITTVLVIMLIGVVMMLDVHLVLVAVKR